MTDKRENESPDLEGLRKFAESKDRSIAPFFAGRRDEIALVERGLRRAKETIEDNGFLGDETILFQGAPGAGKSSLLNHLAEKWGAAEPSATNVFQADGPPLTAAPRPERPIRRSFIGSVRQKIRKLVVPAHMSSGPNQEPPVRLYEDLQPLVVHVDLEDVPDRKHFVLAIADGFGTRVAKKFRTASKVGREAVSGIGIKASSLSQTNDSPDARLSALAALVRAEGFLRPVLLLIDEIQNIDPDPAIHGAILHALHKGEHGLPIVPVYAGLGNSWDVLGKCGLARPSRGHIRNIGALEVVEAYQTVDMFMARYRIQCTEDEKAEWTERLAGQSNCWPQHLHTALQRLAVALGSSGGRLAGVNKAAAEQMAREDRDETYGILRSVEMMISKRLLAELMTHIPVNKDYGLAFGQVLLLIRELAREGGTDPEGRLPPKMDAFQFQNHLIKKGALQARSLIDDHLHCPVPSFRDWLIRQGLPGPVPEAPKYDRFAPAPLVSAQPPADQPAATPHNHPKP